MINKFFLLFTALMYGWLGGWALFDPASYVDDVGLSITSNLGSVVYFIFLYVTLNNMKRKIF